MYVYAVTELACAHPCNRMCLKLFAVVQVLVPTSQFIRSLVAARLAADVLDVPTVLIARTDAHSAALLTSDVDEVDRAFCTGERTPEGFYRVKEGVKVSHKRLLYSFACDASSADACLSMLCRLQAVKNFDVPCF